MQTKTCRKNKVWEEKRGRKVGRMEGKAEDGERKEKERGRERERERGPEKTGGSSRHHFLSRWV